MTSKPEQSTIPGISLLDYFAGQALAGFMTDFIVADCYGDYSPKQGKIAAKYSYNLAQAMLDERERRKAKK